MKAALRIYRVVYVLSIAFHAGLGIFAALNSEGWDVILTTIGAHIAWILATVAVVAGPREDHRADKYRLPPFIIVAAASVAVLFVNRANMPLGVTGMAITMTLVAVAGPFRGLIVCSSFAGAATVVLGSIFNQNELILPVLLVCGGTLAAGGGYASLLAEWKRDLVALEDSRWAAGELAGVTVRLNHFVDTARRRSVLEDRRHTASMIHDSAGYALTGVLAQLEALRRSEAGEKLGSELLRIENLSRDALRDIRNEVADLRSEDRLGDEKPWTERWEQLVTVFAECTGVQLQFDKEDRMEPPQAVGEAIYHLIQEGLTNSYRHGRASAVLITVRRSNGMWLVKLSDNGIGNAHVQYGSGIRGLEERIQAIGGSLSTRTGSGRGFDIAADIPEQEVMDADSVVDR